MLSSSGQSAAFVGRILHAYLNLVRRTTRFRPTIPGACPWERGREPFIALTWHGQCMLCLAALEGSPPIAIPTSLRFGGAAVACAAELAGLRAIHGSDRQNLSKVQTERTGSALFEMRNALRDGVSVVLAADMPGASCMAGKGAVQLARLSGRPIYLFAAVTSARFDLDQRGRASIALPFGRGCILWSEPLYVRKRADDAEIELIAMDVAERLDDLHASACQALARRRWA
ncbi:lysophospholipid acyltransferase family protein [Bosea thiooxidans]|nr:hypothetical protein [Bosea sp. (in: a-proteobacteria)]